MKKQGPPSKPTYMCRACTASLCADCASMAGEYEYLLSVRTMALAAAESEREKAVRERDLAVKRAEEWERIMKLGQHALILAWMNSQTPEQIRVKAEKAVEA